MERWVIQELRQTDDKWLQAREKVFLNLMSRQQLEKLLQLLNGYGIIKTKSTDSRVVW
jgi:hypothetical protein